MDPPDARQTLKLLTDSKLVAKSKKWPAFSRVPPERGVVILGVGVTTRPVGRDE